MLKISPTQPPGHHRRHRRSFQNPHPAEHLDCHPFVRCAQKLKRRRAVVCFSASSVPPVLHQSIPLLGWLQEKDCFWLWLWLWLLRFPNRLAEVLAGAPVRIARLLVRAEARGDSAAGRPARQRSSSWWMEPCCGCA